MSTRLFDAFEVCLAAMATGVDLESCLSLYPSLHEELRQPWRVPRKLAPQFSKTTPRMRWNAVVPAS